MRGPPATSRSSSLGQTLRSRVSPRLRDSSLYNAVHVAEDEGNVGVAYKAVTRVEQWEAFGGIEEVEQVFPHGITR